MSEDIYDRIAQEVEDRDIYSWPGNTPSGEDFAAAFRWEFARRTCASCFHVLTSDWNGVSERWICMKLNTNVPPQPFSCSIWTAKPEAK